MPISIEERAACENAHLFEIYENPLSKALYIRYKLIKIEENHYTFYFFNILNLLALKKEIYLPSNKTYSAIKKKRLIFYCE